MNTHMNRVFLVLMFVAVALLLLPGCDTLGKKFENRLVITIDGTRAFVNSLYGPIGISSELSESDAAEIRRLLSKGP